MRMGLTSRLIMSQTKSPLHIDQNDSDAHHTCCFVSLFSQAPTSRPLS